MWNLELHEFLRFRDGIKWMVLEGMITSNLSKDYIEILNQGLDVLSFMRKNDFMMWCLEGFGYHAWDKDLDLSEFTFEGLFFFLGWNMAISCVIGGDFCLEEGRQMVSL